MGRNAGWYLVGLAASLLGNSALSLVAGIWVKSLTGSDASAALVSVCMYAPSLLGPVGGLLADRFRRRPLLVVVNLASGALVLPLLAVRSAGQVWVIDAVMLGYGLSLVLIGPAESALFAVLLPTEARHRFNGIRLALQEAGRLVAPLLGAGLFVLLGGGAVAAVDAGTFVLATLVLLPLRITEAHPEPSGRPWRAELVAGFRHLFGDRELAAVTIAGTVAMAVSGVGVAAQYGMVDALHRPPSFLGPLTSLLGAGSILASLTSARLIRRIGERWLAVLGLCDGALGNALRATGWVPSVLVGSLVLGFALPWTVVAVLNLSQSRTPDALQGRVSAAVTLALFAPQPVAQLIGAGLIGPLGYRVIYLAQAALTLATAAWLGWWVRKPVRSAG